MSTGDLGAALERLPGVLAATVFPDPKAGPRVYLAIDAAADHDAIKATTLALLRDRGVRPDPDRVHVGTAPVAPRIPTALPSLSLDAIEVHRTENLVECTVRLRTGARSLTGTAIEPDSRPGRARAAARATLAAAQNLDPELRLGLHGAATQELFGFEVLAVLVEAALGSAHIHLPGTAPIERSLEHAAAFATIYALRSWTP